MYIISPTEDLMREHGILNRLMLIYEKLLSQPQIDLFQAVAKIVRNFIHDYHEILEEKYIFSLVQQRTKNPHIQLLVNQLINQHQIARQLTSNILGTQSIKNIENYAIKFVTMYRAHESREDTEIFTEFNNLSKNKERLQFGEIFEQTEDEKFGEHGFQSILDAVITLEKFLQINSITSYE